ncbi:MAG: hypothetical protein E7580_02305 [Ruminococcaceae bacterium]|nr:hypothetical protein [Oscillospiraceae bacterium]
MSRSLIGEKVIHKNLGEGSIISWSLPYFQVYYEKQQKQIKHNYPDAFRDFLKFTDPELQSEADALLGAKQEAEEQRLLNEEAAKQRALEQALAAARPARKRKSK